MRSLGLNVELKSMDEGDELAEAAE
jgi:hypothetical protein